MSIISWLFLLTRSFHSVDSKVSFGSQNRTIAKQVLCTLHRAPADGMYCGNKCLIKYMLIPTPISTDPPPPPPPMQKVTSWVSERKSLSKQCKPDQTAPDYKVYTDALRIKTWFPVQSGWAYTLNWVCGSRCVNPHHSAVLKLIGSITSYYLCKTVINLRLIWLGKHPVSNFFRFVS